MIKEENNSGRALKVINNFSFSGLTHSHIKVVLEKNCGGCELKSRLEWHFLKTFEILLLSYYLSNPL